MRSLSRTLAAVPLLLVLLPAGSAVAQVVEYYHSDALGSVRAITNQSGVVVERHDYLPFGEEWNPPAPRPDNQPVRFTGKERDQETGLDYFGARYYGARIARFTTIDPVYTWADNLADPQRWNRYAYVRNNPFRYVDPDGRTLVLAGPAANQRRAEAVANSGLFGQDLTIGSDGKATLRSNGEVGPPSPEQTALAEVLGVVIKDRATTTVSVSSGSGTTIVGNFATQDIDVADMEMFGRGPGISMASTFGHEVTEQYVKQVKGGSNYLPAHEAAIGFENGISGWNRAADLVTLDGSGTGVASTAHTRGAATLTTTLTLTTGNVTGVSRHCTGSGCP